jgi:excinuclease UvrABC ATPase subunit
MRLSSESDRFDTIQVRGARENNLKNISVDIPRRRITVSIISSRSDLVI